MRTRLLALPFLAATTLAVLGASPAAPAATPNPCLPHEIPVRGRGLDGGVGCHDPRRPEGPADMLRARAVFDGPRSEVSGADRLAALRQAQSMKMAAQRLREKTGASDFATASGTVLQGTGRAWVALGPSPLIVDDPKYPGGQGYGNDKVQGRVAALLADPADPTGNTIYLGSSNGGVWKSTNAGETWTSVGDSLPSQSTGALAMAGNGWLFVGLGEGNTGSNNYAGAGVVRSKDGGETWSDLLPGIPEGIVTTHIAIAGDTVLVGTQRGLFRSDDLGDSFSRATLPTGGTGESDKAFGNFVTDVRFQPGSEDNALAAVGWRSGGIGTAAGLYRTTDGGATWTKVAATGFGSASTSTDPIGRVTLAYDERDGQEDVVWALIQDAGKLNNEPFPVDIAVGAEANTTNLNGIYRSGDNGDTWVVQANNQTLMAAPGSGISTTNLPLNGNYGPGVQAWYNQYVAVDPSAPIGTERVVVGLEEVYQGTLAVAQGAVAPPLGTQWQTIGRYWNACIQAVLVQLNCADLGLPGYTGYTTHADQHAAAWAKTPDGWMLYVGNDGGVYRQPAAAGGYDNDSWTSLNAGGVNTTQPYAAAMGRDGTVYLGLQDNGTAKISPDGTANEVIGGDGFDVAVDPADSDVAWEEYANGILRITRDGGVNWSGDVSPTAATGQRFSTPFELDPTDAEHFLYAGNQVFEHESASAMSASSWVQVFDVRNDEVSPDAAVTALDVQGTAAYAAWCGRPPTPPAGSSACNTTTGDGNFEPNLFRRGIVTNVAAGCARAKASTECWRHVAAKGLPNRLIQGVEIDPVDPMTVYVAVASYSRHWAYDPDTLMPGVVFRSTDGGKNFTNVSGDLPQTFGSDVLVHGDLLIAATDVGVFATSAKDPGDWVPMGTGIPDAVPAIEISTNPQGTKLVLATHGRGVWAMPLTPVARNTDEDDDGGTGGGGGGGGPIASTGLPAWALLGATVPAVGAVLLRRLLRAVRE